MHRLVREIQEQMMGDLIAELARKTGLDFETVLMAAHEEPLGIGAYW